MTRRTSLPYPTGPPPPPPFSTQSYETPSDEVENPSGPHKVDLATTNATYQESENPWSAEVPVRNTRLEQPLPPILRAGHSQTYLNGAGTSGDQSLSNVPHILRAGRSHEDTPRSSLESNRSKDFWEDSGDEQETGQRSPKKGHNALKNTGATESPWDKVDSTNDTSQGIKRRPVGSPYSSPDPTAASGFASNNPFRRPSQQAFDDGGLQAPGPGQSIPLSSTKGKESDRGGDLPHTNHFQGLTFEKSTLPDLLSYHAQPPQHSSAEAWEKDAQSSLPPMPQAPPPPVPPQTLSPFSSQPPLIPVMLEISSSDSPWEVSHETVIPPTPSPIPFTASQKQVSSYNDELLDRGEHQNGAVSLREELETLPNAAQHGGTESNEEPSLLDDEDEDRPPLRTRPTHADTDYYEPPEGPPPRKPPRPTLSTAVISDEEVARMMEQRNETYQIKHFNWFDHSSRKLRRSSMLTQNNNGPCPLLALVNALILGAKDESQAALDEALRTREQVTLGLIIETLMDELLSRGYSAAGDVMPDVDELNHFLMRLRTGMNANPRFVPPSAPVPNLMDADDSMSNMPQHLRNSPRLGTFEPTTDMRLYGAFQIPLIHGWLPEPGSAAANAFERSAQTYEDAQALQFGEEELEYKLTRTGLSEPEEEMWQDINSIKDFLRANPTQLSPIGLKAVHESIPSGSFAIMFRNDHFSTIYKHPESGQLFTLITDAGYADRDEFIWESLVDINGKDNEFFSGDFMPVSHSQVADDSATHPASRRTSQLLSPGVPPSSAAPMSPQEVQEQHDADFAMALQLQEEEEQRQRAERNRRRSSGGPPLNTPQQPRRPQAGNIPIPLRGNQQSSHQTPEVRPPIPPRGIHATHTGVTRSAEVMGEDAPPVYEEAVKGRPYIPPVGSPLHPSANPSPMASNTQLTGTLSNVSQHSASGSSNAVPGTYDSQSSQHPPGPNVGVLRRDGPRRRFSAYNEMQSGLYPGQQGGRLHPQSAVLGPAGRGGRGRDDRDCIVM